MTVAGDDSELALMAEAAARPDAPNRGVELLDASGVRDVNPAIKGDLVGGLWCRQRRRGRTRLGARRRPRMLEATGHYRWLPGRQAVDVQPAGARRCRARGRRPAGYRHQGSLVICASATDSPGSAAGSVPPSPPPRCDGAGYR